MPTHRAKPQAGILIYTAAADSDGTLGGLVDLGKPENLGRLLEQALNRSKICSSDPLCSEHDPEKDRSLHAAACHACSLVAETSCERGNRYLDRSLLVPTLERGPTLLSSRGCDMDELLDAVTAVVCLVSPEKVQAGGPRFVEPRPQGERRRCRMWSARPRGQAPSSNNLSMRGKTRRSVPTNLASMLLAASHATPEAASKQVHRTRVDGPDDAFRIGAPNRAGAAAGHQRR
jgi:hypothetical protein